mgnify:CR=1 FL=1
MISWFQIAVFLAVAILGFSSLTATGIAALRVAAAALAGFVTLALLLLRFPLLGVGDLVRSTMRPALATAIMALGLTGWEAFGDGEISVDALSLKVAIGVIMYLSATFGLWVAVGYPDGQEQFILWRFIKLLNRWRI